MKRLFILSVVAFAAFATAISCQQEEFKQVSQEPDEPAVQQDAPVVWTLDAGFVADETSDPQIEPASRTYMDGTKIGNVNKVVWSIGDQIVVNGVTSLALTSADIDSEDASKAHFQFTSVPQGDELVCIYPASAYSTYQDTLMAVTFPADQSYDPATASYDTDAAILIGVGSGSSCEFQHAATYLKITCDKAIKSIRVMANAHRASSNGAYTAGMALSGARKVATEKSYLTEVILGDTGSTITADFGNAGLAASTPVVLAVPPRDFNSGLNFLVVTTDDKYQIFRAESAIKLSTKLGKLLNVSLTLDNLKAWSGPGIYSIDDWCSFTVAYESSYATTDIYAGNYDEWKGSDGEVNLYSDINANGNIRRIGALFTGVAYSNTNTPFVAVLDGNGHTITQAASLVPIMYEIGAAGVVKNLTLSGAQTAYSNNQISNTAFCVINNGTIQDCVCDIDYTFSGATNSETPYYVASFCRENNGAMTDCTNTGDITISKMITGSTMMYKVASIAGLVKVNKGTMTRCKNQGTINATVFNQSLNFAGVAAYNEGTMTGCENNAPITIDYAPTGTQIFYGGGVAAAADDAYTFEGGTMSAATDIKATTSGFFYECKNTGDITIRKKPSWSGVYWLKGDAVGGIVGAINHGQWADPNEHNYTEISKCTNSGNIRILSNTTGWGKSGGQVGSAVGGILGRACAYANNGYGAYDVNNASSLPGNYFVMGLTTDSRWTVANTGNIEITSTNTSAFSGGMSGARQVYAGGIVGFATGGYKTNGTSYVYSIVRYASSEGTISIGGSYNSVAAGGIAGGCSQMKLIACKATTEFEKSAGADGLLVPTSMGIAGGCAGWVSGACQIQDCRVSMTVPAAASPLYAGFMNIKNGLTVTKVTANSSFTGTINGAVVTADNLNGVTGGTGTYAGDFSININ